MPAGWHSPPHRHLRPEQGAQSSPDTCSSGHHAKELQWVEARRVPTNHSQTLTEQNPQQYLVLPSVPGGSPRAIPPGPQSPPQALLLGNKSQGDVGDHAVRHSKPTPYSLRHPLGPKNPAIQLLREGTQLGIRQLENNPSTTMSLCHPQHMPGEEPTISEGWRGACENLPTREEVARAATL